MLDRCGKKYGSNKTIGSELFGAVVDLHISDFEVITMTRIAVILANLTSDRVVDGISKLLVKSDVSRLTGPNCRNATLQLDAKLNKGYAMARTLYENGNINIEDFDELVCKFFTRCILHVCNKSKSGPEGVSYKDLQEVCSAFMTDATAMVGEGVVIDTSGTWKPTEAVASMPKQGGPAKVSSMLTSDEQQDPTFVLESKGFKINQVVVEKGLGLSHGMYALTEITPNDVKLDELTTFGPSRSSVRMAHDAFIKNWLKYGGAVPFSVPIVQTPCACGQRSVQVDVIRCKVFESINAYELKQSTHRSLQYAFNPAIVVTTVKYDAGKLEFAPFTDLNKIKCDKNATASPIKVGDAMMYAYPPTKATSATKLEEASSADILFIPYWWVESTDIAEAANMKRVSVTDGDMQYSIFQNSRVVQPFTRLMYFKAKDKKQALVGAKRVKIDK